MTETDRDAIRSAYSDLLTTRPEMTAAESAEADALLAELGDLMGYTRADARGDQPCVVTDGVDAEALARWAAMGADVLGGVS